MTKIAFQGAPGAYSELAALTLFPAATPLPCTTFATAFDAVIEGAADCAVIPVENIIAGRVADVHALLPDSGLAIVGEHFEPIVHHLLGLPSARLAEVRTVLSHTQGLAQCRRWLHERPVAIHEFFDTAGAAAEVARRGDKSLAAIASARAGALYGLVSLSDTIADNPRNLTRFLVLARAPVMPAPGVPAMTTLTFRLRSEPAGLYRALAGFADHAINLTRIESQVSPEDFRSATFIVDIEGASGDPAVGRALAALGNVAEAVTLLGSYPQADWRRR